jgi:hypothetical protein
MFYALCVVLLVIIKGERLVLYKIAVTGGAG